MRLVLILAALAAPHTTIDRTLSCPVFQEGEALLVSAQGSVSTPRGGAYLKFWPTPLAFDEPAVLPGVEVDRQPGKVIWDPRHKCDDAKPIAFSKRGLKLDTVVTTKFVGSADARCRAAARIRFRIRIAEAHGRPTSAQLVAVADNVARPLLYVEWTPVKISYWLRPGCTA